MLRSHPNGSSYDLDRMNRMDEIPEKELAGKWPGIFSPCRNHQKSIPFILFILSAFFKNRFGGSREPESGFISGEIVSGAGSVF